MKCSSLIWSSAHKTCVGHLSFEISRLAGLWDICHHCWLTINHYVVVLSLSSLAAQRLKASTFIRNAETNSHCCMTEIVSFCLQLQTFTPSCYNLENFSPPLCVRNNVIGQTFVGEQTFVKLFKRLKTHGWRWKRCCVRRNLSAEKLWSFTRERFVDK